MFILYMLNLNDLTQFDMGFLEPSVMAMMGPHHNFVLIASMNMKFVTGIELHVFYRMATRKFVTSLPLRNYDGIPCILADA